MKDCLFCKIVKGKIPSYKVYEDKDHLAILDIFPNTKGLTLVIPKKHLSSDVFEMLDKELKEFIIAIKKVVKILEKKIPCQRIGLIFEGMGINHLHAKLYPMHGLDKKFKEIIHPKKIFFKKYEGYLTTLMGPRADDKELKKLAEKIKNSQINSQIITTTK